MPLCERHTFAQLQKASAKKKTDTAKGAEPMETAGEELPHIKRQKQTCSYCKEIGHANRVGRGKPSCPKRVSETADDS